MVYEVKCKNKEIVENIQRQVFFICFVFLVDIYFDFKIVILDVVYFNLKIIKNIEKIMSCFNSEFYFEKIFVKFKIKINKYIVNMCKYEYVYIKLLNVLIKFFLFVKKY